MEGHKKQAKDKQVKKEEYLSLESEPDTLFGEDSSFGLKEELFSNRYFLKHRVWRNMKKMRRQNGSPSVKLNTHQAHTRKERARLQARGII